jgi:hypothetical protein
MPNFDVWPTAVADRQLRDLRGQTRKNAEKAMDRLERRGCEAADYHLEGDEVLYESLGIELPTITERKGHPPCCPTGEAPVDRGLVDSFIAGTQQLRRRTRGRQRRR